MDPTTLIVGALCVLAYGLVSHRIESTPLTAPMLFTAIGLVAGPAGLGVLKLNLDGIGTDIVIELTLILVLFTDASRIRLRELKRGYHLPARLLIVGMPLTIGAGMLLAWPLFPGLAWIELALIAAILTPTDAALGQVVVCSSSIPIRIRQALNVESGLNDGIAVPIVVALLAAAAGMSEGAIAIAETAPASESGLRFALSQVILGPLAGVAVAWPAGRLIQRAVIARSMNLSFVYLSGVAIALGSFGAAELIGGNGFIAAFAAGLVIGNSTETIRERMQEFAESEGELLALIVFMVFGAVMLPPALKSLDWPIAIYIALSLTVIRMVPVAVALWGSGLRSRSVAFLGWFGPRGLATILFALLVAEAELLPNRTQIFDIGVLAVAASILAHGLSAAPLGAAYGKWVARLRAAEPQGPECRDAPALPVRVRLREERKAAKAGRSAENLSK